MRKILPLILAALSACAWGQGNQNNFNSGGNGVGIYTVATLPAAPTKATLATVKDGSTSSDCSTGAGSNVVVCIFNGSSWVFAGNSGSNPTFAQVGAGANTAALTMGNGGSLGPTGTGTLNANQILGNTVPTLATGFLNWTGSAWAFSAGGGGDTITSPNSTLTVGGTATATTLDLNLATANTWTTPQTFAPSSTSQVALVANNPTSTSVNIAAFKVNNVTEAAIGNSGTITLGDGTNAAGVILKNATSGQVTLKTVTGALGAVSASLPANTGTIAELNLAQTFSAEITTAASATGTAGFNLPPGAAPTAPVNGDLWSTSSGFFGRVAGVTVGPFSASGGGGNTTSTSLTTGFYAEANGANSIINGTCDSGITTANTFTCSDTAGIAGVSFTGSGSNGGYVGTQGTGANVVFGAGKSGFYPDSVNNCLHQNLNNVDKNCIPNTAGSGIGLTTGGTISVSAAPLSDLATQAADSVVMNATGSTAVPTAVAMPTCATSGHADVYDPSTHAWTCNVLSGGTSTIANGTSAMGTGAISSGTCATVVTTTATGVAATDAIIVSPNADPTGVTGYAVSATGSLYIQSWPTSGNVNFKVCNNTAGSLTPAALTLNWRVVR